MSIIGGPYIHPSLTNQRPAMGRSGYSFTTYGRRKKPTVSVGREEADKTIQEFLGDRYKMPRKYGRKRVKKTKKGIVRRYIPRAIVPKRKIVRFKAVTNFTPTLTSGAIDVAPIQMNSFDDPFMALTDAQPLGYDQWKALYKYAHVIGSKVTIRAFNSGSSSILLGITPMSLNQGTTELTLFDHYMECPGTKTKLLSPDVDHVTMFHKINVKKHLGVKNLLDTNEYRVDLPGEVAPTKMCYWHVWAQSQDRSTSGSAIITMTAEYVIVLHDYITPARSTET